jgi:hypothetical protein
MWERCTLPVGVLSWAFGASRVPSLKRASHTALRALHREVCFESQPGKHVPREPSPRAFQIARYLGVIQKSEGVTAV